VRRVQHGDLTLRASSIAFGADHSGVGRGDVVAPRAGAGAMTTQPALTGGNSAEPVNYTKDRCRIDAASDRAAGHFFFAGTSKG
jgi:hypothetical protein